MHDLGTSESVAPVLEGWSALPSTLVGRPTCWVTSSTECIRTACKRRGEVQRNTRNQVFRTLDVGQDVLHRTSNMQPCKVSAPAAALDDARKPRRLIFGCFFSGSCLLSRSSSRSDLEPSKWKSLEEPTLSVRTPPTSSRFSSGACLSSRLRQWVGAVLGVSSSCGFRRVMLPRPQR